MTFGPERSVSGRTDGVTFKGNKASLPSKPCVACGRAMTWRKRWARSWDEVKFCSDACRGNLADVEKQGA